MERTHSTTAAQADRPPTPAGRRRRAGGSRPVPGVGLWARWLGAAAIYLAISRLHQHISILGRLSAPALLSGASLLLLLSATREWRPRDLLRHWLSRGVLAIVAIAVVGVPFSIYPGNSFTFLNEAYSRTLLLGIIAWAISRTPDGARFMAKTVALSTLTAALLALKLGRTDSSGRLSGAYTYDANDLALVSVVTIPLIVWWATDKANRFRAALAATIPVLVWVTIKTGSRGGGLGLAALLIGFLLVSRIPGAPRIIKRVGLSVVVVGVLSIPLVPSDYIGRLQSITAEDDYNRTSPRGRIQVWKRGIGYAFDYPVFGVGIANFGKAEGWLSEIGQERQARGMGWKWSTAHNSFVQVLAELGLIAGTLFPLLLLRTIAQLSLWHRQRPPPRTGLEMLAPLLGLTFLAYVVTGFFLSFAYYDLVYVLFGLAGGMLLQRGQQAAAAAPGPALPADRRARPARPAAAPAAPAAHPVAARQAEPSRAPIAVGAASMARRGPLL